ncbi:MAG: hypothetical protein CMG67_01860 [Candidatus Marinimicrobia bacterium]|nr:hypothetical protein [Candidatus Neomarinimicrobiota bacterium]|tara:strand:- start:11414 stop:11989 length:576 start_codon:yes stop_codon:yes gene_type:complete
MKKFFIYLVFFTLLCKGTIAAEAGMPQLDPKYWASQAFWLTLIFLSIYLLIAKIFIPKIKGNIDTREDKIRKDLEEAKMFREEAEKKLKIYNEIINNAKVETKKTLLENRQRLNEDIQIKKDKIQKEIDKATKDTENEIKKFKSESITKMSLMSEEIVSELLKNILGEDGNKSSIKATVSEVIKEKDKVKL